MTNNKTILAWIDEMKALVNPDQVVWIDGSEAVSYTHLDVYKRQRYDGLVEEVGGKPTPALGFGLGLDRILMAMNEMGADFGNGSKCEVYIASLGEAAQMKAFQPVSYTHLDVYKRQE